MVKANLRYNTLQLFGLVFFLLLSFVVFDSVQASARTLLEPKNIFETRRAGLCNDPARPYTIYGVVWVNGSLETDTTDARWAEDLVVPWNAGLIDATMWTTAANCAYGATRTGARIINLAPASGGSVPISFPYGTTINRGDSTPGTFADPPGSRRVRVDVTGKSLANGERNCNFSIAYSGTYQDSRGTGASAVYPNTICITRQVRPLAATWELVGTTAQDKSFAKRGQSALFTHDIENLGPADSSGWGYRVKFINYAANGSTLGPGDVGIDANPVSLNAGFRLEPARTHTSIISSTAEIGSRQCEYIIFRAKKSPLAAGEDSLGSSTMKCVTVVSDGYVIDECENVDGIQDTVPFGLTKSSNGSNNCFDCEGGTDPSKICVPPPGGGNPGPGPGPTPIPCPGDPEIAADSKVTVALPDQTPKGQVDAPSGTNTSSSETYQQAVPKGRTEVTAVSDISSPNALGVNVSLPVPGPADQSYESARIDYANFATTTPYDLNQASVVYSSYYTATDWYKTFDRYQCDGQSTQSGSSCNYSYTAYSTPECTGMYYSGTCYNNGTAPTGDPASCDTKTDLFGTCYDTSPPTFNYYCDYGDGFPNGSNVCEGSRPATVYYRWTNNGSYEASKPNNVPVPKVMEACYNRDFQVTDANVIANKPTFSIDNEDPEVVNISTNRVVAEFSLQHGGQLRNAAQAKSLRYAGTYTVIRGDGSGEDPLYSKPGTDTVIFDTGLAVPTGPTWTEAPNYNYGNSFEARIDTGKLRPGDTVCMVFTVSPAGTEVTRLGDVAGGGSGSSTAVKECSTPTANNPYVRMYGLDVSAGGVFATGDDGQCLGATQTVGNIRTNLRDISRGAGNQFAAFARGDIENFATASLRSSAPIAKDGLAFANGPALGLSGSFGEDHCIPDFTASYPEEASQPLGNGSGGGGPDFANLSFLNGPGNPEERQAYRSTTDTILKMNGKGLKYGNRVTIYVEGDVYIEDDLEYFNDSLWSTPKDIPSLTIISTGNIYIGKDVKRIDGLLIAQSNNPGTGQIYTCAPPGFTTYSKDSLFTNCNSQLVVNGALIARDVKFARTFASLRNAISKEAPDTDPFLPANKAACAGNFRLGTRTRVDHDCAAEIINFSPEMYLSEPALNPTGGPETAKYDYITSLSPVL